MRQNLTRWALLIVISIFATNALAMTPVKHVVIVVLENHGYSEVVGSSSMPYFNSLIQRGSLNTNYYANAHPSLPNYFVLTTGKKIATSNSYSGSVTANNIVRALMLAGKTWKAYAEALPYAGYVGGDRYPYVKHHNPFAYLSEVKNSSSERLNIVPFTRFASDVNNNNLPNYSFVIPSDIHNGHDNSLAGTDKWLKYSLGRLLASSAFRSSGVLIVVFDEAQSTDHNYGGGRVVMLRLGTGVSASRVGTFSQHQRVLRMSCTLLQLSACPVN